MQSSDGRLPVILRTQVRSIVEDMVVTDFSVSRSRWLAALLTASALLGACDGPPVVRQGPPEQRVVARAYSASTQTIRADVLAAFSARRATLPSPFSQMTVSELRPPRFSSDWFATFVDIDGFLEDYKRLAPEIRRDDLLLDEPTGDWFWPSEYETAAGPVRFRCGFIVHFADTTREATIEVYETVPSVWVGEHWALTAHGVGFGRYHDIRFVEPTMQDRVRVLDLIARIVQERG